MAKIFDYSSFASGKSGAFPSLLNFECEIRHTDIDIHNTPEEYDNINNSSVYLDYSVEMFLKKSGISSLLFHVNSIELELAIDDYPNGEKEFDIDLIPGRTIDYGQIQAQESENIIPTYPNKIEIDMGKSIEPRNWKITIEFGSNYRYS